MGGMSVFKRRAGVKKSIAGAAAAAAALGTALFWGCVGDKDVDEPLRVRDAIEIPLNFELNLNDLMYARASDATKEAIDRETEDDPLDTADRNDLSSAILDDEGLIDYIAENKLPDGYGNFRAYVRDFLETNPAAKRISDKKRWSARKKDDIAKEVAEEIDRLKNDPGLSAPKDLPVRVDALNSFEIPSLIREKPVVNYRVDLTNASPFDFTVYALFFKGGREEYINGMDSVEFLDFMKNGRYSETGGDINLFYDAKDGLTGFTVSACDTAKLSLGTCPPSGSPPQSEPMNGRFGGWMTGSDSLFSRWIIKPDMEPAYMLKQIKRRDDGKDYILNVKMSVKVEFTLDVDTLFNM